MADSRSVDTRIVLIAVIAVGSVAVVLLSTPFLIHWYASWYAVRNVQANLGVIGDMFGLANAIVSGLAFTGLVITIALQRVDIGLQRKELRESHETREEQLGLDKTRSSFERLFGLLSLQSEIVRLTRARESTRVERLEATGDAPSGLLAFVAIRNRVVSHIRSEAHRVSSAESWTDAARAARVGRCFAALYQVELNEILGHYFRTTYKVFQYVDQAVVSDTDRADMAQIAAARLSDAEMVILFYYCLSELGRHDFRPLVIKYSLVEHIDPGDLAFPDDYQLLAV